MHRDEPTKPRKWVWVLAVVLVTLLAFGLRWYYVSTAMVIEPVRADAAQYYHYAWNLAHHGVFASNPPHSQTLTPNSYRDPGYPAMLAIGMKLFHHFGSWYAAVLMFQALLGALTITFAMLLGRHWLDWRWLTAAGVLAASWPHNIVITSDLLIETLFGFLCVLSMYLCAHALRRSSVACMALAGLGFGAASLVNAVLLPFGALLAVYFAWRKYATRRVWITLLVCALVLPAAWAVRNARLPPAPPEKTSMGRALQNLEEGSRPLYHTAYHAAAHGHAWGFHVLHTIKNEASLLQKERATGLKAIAERMKAHPGRYLSWYARKPWLLWAWNIQMGQNDIYAYATAHSPFDNQPAMRALEATCEAINPILACLMLACLILVPVRRFAGKKNAAESPALEATLALVSFVTLVYSALQSEPRYSIPFRPFEMLLAMTALATLVNWLRHRIHASRRQLAHG